MLIDSWRNSGEWPCSTDDGLTDSWRSNGAWAVDVFESSLLSSNAFGSSLSGVCSAAEPTNHLASFISEFDDRICLLPGLLNSEELAANLQG